MYNSKKSRIEGYSKFMGSWLAGAFFAEVIKALAGFAFLMWVGYYACVSPHLKKGPLHQSVKQEIRK